MGMVTSRRARRAFIAAGASTIALCPGGAHAQSSFDPNRPKITLSAQARYDSNVSGTTAAQAASLGVSRSDEHVNLNAALNLDRRMGIFDASLVGYVGYNIYARNTRLSREKIGLNGALLANLSRCQINLTSSLDRGQSDLGDIVIVTGAASANVQNVETKVRYGAEVGCGGAIGLRPGFGIVRSTGTNSASIRKFSNFNRMDYTASLRYAQPVFGELWLIGTLSDADNPNRPRVGSAVDGYKSTVIGVRFERKLGASLKGSVQVNYDRLTPRRNVTPFSGITYEANLTATFGDRLQLAAVVSRDTSPALQSDAVYSVIEIYGLDATFAATDRLSFGLGGSYRKSRYPGAGALGGVPLNNNKRKSLTANVTYRASDRLRFAIDGIYTTRDADGTLFDSDNTGVGISASLAL